MKPEKFKVNLSSTFPLKNRCKYCATTPKYYYLTRTSSTWQDYEVVLFINMWIANNHKRMCQNYYLIEMPKDYTTISSFDHSIDYKGYNPRFHKNHKNHNLYANSNTIDYLSCQCGRTRWAFNETMSKNRPEISQRKARFTFKAKFSF